MVGGWRGAGLLVGHVRAGSGVSITYIVNSYETSNESYKTQNSAWIGGVPTISPGTVYTPSHEPETVRLKYTHFQFILS